MNKLILKRFPVYVLNIFESLSLLSISWAIWLHWCFRCLNDSLFVVFWAWMWSCFFWSESWWISLSCVRLWWLLTCGLYPIDSSAVVIMIFSICPIYQCYLEYSDSGGSIDSGIHLSHLHWKWDVLYWIVWLNAGQRACCCIFYTTSNQGGLQSVYGHSGFQCLCMIWSRLEYVFGFDS